jgi:hypothetical protein
MQRVERYHKKGKQIRHGREKEWSLTKLERKFYVRFLIFLFMVQTYFLSEINVLI